MRLHFYLIATALCLITTVAGLTAPGSAKLPPPPPPPSPVEPGPKPPPPNKTHDLPTTFSWTSTPALIAPQNSSQFQIVSIKDPSIVHFNGVYHVFGSIVSSSQSYNLVYLNFTSFSQPHTSSSPQFFLELTAIGSGYRAAPQIFFFAPHKLWYLIFQNGNCAYSTNPDISDPAGWSAPTNFFSAVPQTVQDNWGTDNPGWLDMWVICDAATCHLFSSDDQGNLYRSQTPLNEFPNWTGETVVAMKDPNRFALYEASNVYSYGDGRFLLLVEAIGSDGNRFFRSWNSTDLAGPWNELADTEANPFARSTNVVAEKGTGTLWTQDISHGEMIRNSFDQTLTISPCNLRYIYQGDTPGNYTQYNDIPWRLALLTQTNSLC